MVCMRFPRRNESLLTLLLIAGGATTLFAQMDTGEERSFAYAGYLAEGGTPAITPHDLQFALFTSPTANTDCLADDPATSCGVWSETHDAVPMSAGNFAVKLGRGDGDALTDAVLNGNALYLGIAVRSTGVDPTFSVLEGLTELSAVPWAARAAAAKNYTVSGQLTAGSVVVGGNASVSGQLTAASIASAGNIVSTGANSELGVSADKFLTDRFGDRFLRLFSSQSSSTYAEFAARDFFAERELIVLANTWQTGPSNQAEQNFNSNGGFVFQRCPNGQFVCGLGLRHASGDSQYWTGARVQLQCCEL